LPDKKLRTKMFVKFSNSTGLARERFLKEIMP